MLKVRTFDDLYYSNRIRKRPDLWKKKYYQKRDQVINALGGKCNICGETNYLWLRIGYKKVLGWKHPRSAAFILKNLEDFQVLCANHHQEKSIKDRFGEQGDEPEVRKAVQFGFFLDSLEHERKR